MFKQAKGVPSGVVESPFGLHVLLVTDLQPASVKPSPKSKRILRLKFANSS